MRPGLKALVLILPLAVLAAAKLPAQPPPFPLDPPPIVQLLDVSVVGPDLTVTFDWSAEGAAPPALAWMRLLDSQGQNAGTVGVAPVYGSQVVYIPGGASARPGDSTTGPMSRYLSLIADDTREILLENQLSFYAGGPATVLAPSWPLPFFWSYGRQCYLHVVNVTCSDPEDANGDEPYLSVPGWGIWRGGTGIPAGRTMTINATPLLCDTCQNIRKTIKLDLYDQDDPGFPIFDPDDHLGSETVSGCNTIPLKTVKMSGSNYTYWLRYRVACIDDLCP